MKTKLRYKIPFSALTILLVGGWLYAHCGSCPGDNAKQAVCKKEKTEARTLAAMDFTLKDLDGKPVPMSQFKGKIVVLEWTNYDCPFVKAHYKPQKQTTADLARKYADNDVVWLTINSTFYSTAEATKAWVEELNLPQTILMDTDGKAGRLFGAKTTPHIFIFDKEGKLAYRGALDNAPLDKPADEIVSNYADKALSELTSGKPVSIIETRPYGCSVKYPPEKDNTDK